MDVIVHQARLRDGTRHVMQISEITGMDGPTILMQDLFMFEFSRDSGNGALGRLVPTGIVPHFAERLLDRGVELPTDLLTR